MLHHIKKLHKHPEHVREKIAAGGALAVTLVIFVAWMATLDTRLAFSDWEESGDQVAAGASVNGLTVVTERDAKPNSPVEILRRKVGETYSGFREAVGY